MATKKLKTLWKVRIIWMVCTKSELKVHFIILNQSLRLEWEWWSGVNKPCIYAGLWRFKSWNGNVLATSDGINI